LIQTYKYDSLDRLTEAEEKSNGTQTWIQQFGYDRYGNRTSFNQLIGSQQTNTTPTVDTNTNRFTTGQGYVYDLNGNLIQDAEGRQFTFNGDNKQAEVKDSQNNSIGEYSYDGEGKRIKKITNLEITIFVYNGAGQLIAEYSTQTNSSPTTSYLTNDNLGSPRVITDSLGQIISRRDFMPFGEEIYSGIGGRTENQKYTQNGVDNIRKRFTGYEKDTETGLDFAEARYYHNAHGRFTAVDPLLASGKSANPQTFNRYAYTMNNPVNLVDPSGMISESTGACGSRCQTSETGGGGGGGIDSIVWGGFSKFCWCVDVTGYGLNQPNGSMVVNDVIFQTVQTDSSQTQNDVMEQYRRAQKDYPVFKPEDQGIVDQAVSDASNWINWAANSTIMSMLFEMRGESNTMNPKQAIGSLVTTGGLKLIIRNGQPVAWTWVQNVFDGRDSSLEVTITFQGQTLKTTAKLLFNKFPSIGAFTTEKGIILLGPKFFNNNNREGRAKIIIHEAVVHKGFRCKSQDFI
jgi:RHS repeat-associated protein